MIYFTGLQEGAALIGFVPLSYGLETLWVVESNQTGDRSLVCLATISLLLDRCGTDERGDIRSIIVITAT